MLALGILGKLSLWRALQVVIDPRVTDVDFEQLCQRASAQARSSGTMPAWVC